MDPWSSKPCWVNCSCQHLLCCSIHCSLHSLRFSLCLSFILSAGHSKNLNSECLSALSLKKKKERKKEIKLTHQEEGKLQQVQVYVGKKSYFILSILDFFFLSHLRYKSVKKSHSTNSGLSTRKVKSKQLYFTLQELYWNKLWWIE